MNHHQESRFTMFDVVRHLLAENAVILSTLPGCEMQIVKFNELVVQIEEIKLRQIADITGISVRKEQLKIELARTIASIALRLKVYAKLTNNPTMLVDVTFTQNELNKKADTNLTLIAQRICNLAIGNLAALEPYRITQDLLTQAGNGLANYSASISQPRLHIAERKNLTQQLADRFDQTNQVLHKIDLLMKLLPEIQQDIYNNYLNDRRVIDPGTIHLALIGEVTNAKTGFGLTGAVITFTPDGESMNPAEAALTNGAVLVKRSGRRGIFKVKKLKPGIYNAMVSKFGYRNRVMKVVIHDGEMATLKAAILPARIDWRNYPFEINS